MERRVQTLLFCKEHCLQSMPWLHKHTQMAFAQLRAWSREARRVGGESSFPIGGACSSPPHACMTFCTEHAGGQIYLDLDATQRVQSRCGCQTPVRKTWGDKHLHNCHKDVVTTGDVMEVRVRESLRGPFRPSPRTPASESGARVKEGGADSGQFPGLLQILKPIVSRFCLSPCLCSFSFYNKNGAFL